MAGLERGGRGGWAWLRLRFCTSAKNRPLRRRRCAFRSRRRKTPRRLLNLSPDGRKLAFIAGGRLWVHSLESGESRDLTVLSGGTPFWSPDSRFIGYPSEGKLKKIEATGGPPQTVADFRGTYGEVAPGTRTT